MEKKKRFLIETVIISDTSNQSVDSAPQRPPRSQNTRQNPFNRPAPPPPIYAAASETKPSSNTKGNN